MSTKTNGNRNDSRDAPDQNNIQFLRDIEERRRLTPINESTGAKDFAVENFSTPLSLTPAAQKKDKGDPNHQQLLRDMDEGKRLSGAYATQKKKGEKDGAGEDTPRRLKGATNGPDEKSAKGDNLCHLPHDLIERRKLNPVIQNEAPASDLELAKGRFETMPARAIATSPLARKNAPKTETSPTGAVKSMSSANYMKAHLKKREDEAKSLQKTNDQNSADRQKRLEETKKNEKIRARVKELMEQIDWWNKQYGQERYDDSTISATLFELQRELDGIPSVYKN